MSNRRALSNAVKESKQPKQLSKPKDMILDPMGQWKHPGENTRIPSDKITMKGVNYPVLGVSNNGQKKIMQPGQEYNFPGADYVDEFPQLKRGGKTRGLIPMPKPSKKGLASKKYSRSLEATNRLFTENKLFEKPKSRKNKVFDPSAYYFQDGGASSPEEWGQEIKDIEGQIGNPANWTMDDYYLLQDKLNAYKDWRENTPEGQAVNDSHNEEGEYNIPLPEHLQDYTNAMMKARLAYANEFGNPAAQRMINMPDNPYQFENGDTGTHYMASMDNYAVPQIQDENGQLMLGDYGPESAEAMRFDSDEDANYFAEHYKDIAPGFVDMELDDNEIQQYVKGGYVVEDISVPELNTYAEGGEYGCADDEKWDDRLQKCVKIVQNLSESTHYDPAGKKIQTNLFQKLKDAKDAYQNFTKQHRGKKYRLNDADSASSIEQLRKGIQLYKDEYAKEQESTRAELKKLENLKSKAALKNNKDIQNLNLKDLNTVKGKMKIDAAIRNSDLDSGTIAALYKGFNLDTVDRNVMKEGYKGQWQDAVNEANARKEANMGITNTALELFGGGAYRVAADPLGTLKGVGQTVGDIATLPFGLATGVYNYATDGNFDMGTNAWGDSYGKGLSQIGDVLSAIPGLGAAGKLAKFTKAADLAGNIGKSVKSTFQNTYKINPWAFKPNPESYYRMIGKEGYKDALESGVVRPPQTTRIFDQGAQEYKNIPIPQFEEAYYNAQYPLDRRWYPNNIKKTNPKKAAIAQKSGYQGPYMAEVTGESQLFENSENVASYFGPNSSRTVTYSKEHIPISNPNLKFYKEHWLLGYKQVPKVLPGSPSASVTDRLKQFFNRPPGPLMMLGPTGGTNMVKKNIPYYEQLLNTYDSKVMSATNKKFYKDLITTANKQDGMLTEAQLRELDRLKTGNFDFGKRGFNKESLIQVEPKAPIETPKQKKGGVTDDYIEMDIPKSKVQWYIDNGYDVEVLE